MANLLHLFKNVKSTVCAILLAMIVPGLQSCLDEFVNSNQEYDTEVPSIDILNPTPKTMDTLMKLDMPAGVDIEIKL